VFDCNNTSTIPDTRIGNTDWCACGHCPQMTTEHESYCCTESENVRNLKGGLTCITHHESFQSVILNKDTLQAARYQMMLHADNAARREALKKISNRLWQHIAYIQFVYWVNAWSPWEKRREKLYQPVLLPKSGKSMVKRMIPMLDFNLQKAKILIILIEF
jgi:hypothetical protein